MTCYVDDLFTATPRTGQARRYGRQWCHLVCDTSAELHAMAERLGLRRSYVQSPGKPTEHYDLTPPKRAQAVRFGAVEVTGREAFRRAIDGARPAAPGTGAGE